MKDPAKTKVILMAEDDSDDRLLIKEALTECGWDGDLHFVKDGEDLLDYLAQRGDHSPPVSAPRPGLILLDLNMPKKDGREVLREIRADTDVRCIPVVVLTTSKAATDVERMYDLGANSFIAKPTHFDDLVQLLRTLAHYWFNTVELPAPK